MLKIIRFQNSLRFRKGRKKYKIIPFGCYCLPRVITTINNVKPSKKESEKTFPFDLCFSNFECNTNLLSSKFINFYDDLEYDHAKKYWINNTYKLIFNHDNMPMHEFKKRYDNRIKNLYSVLEQTDDYLYFVIATWEVIGVNQVNAFIKEICKYRKANDFSVIIINQSKKVMKFPIQNVYCINLSKDKLFAKININDNWVGELKNMEEFDAALFNYMLNKKITKIMRKTLKAGVRK